MAICILCYMVSNTPYSAPTEKCRHYWVAATKEEVSTLLKFGAPAYFEGDVDLASTPVEVQQL